MVRFPFYSQFPLAALAHQLHRFRPPLDHLVGSERERLSTLIRTIKLRAIRESPLVVTFARS